MPFRKKKVFQKSTTLAPTQIALTEDSDQWLGKSSGLLRTNHDGIMSGSPAQKITAERSQSRYCCIYGYYSIFTYTHFAVKKRHSVIVQRFSFRSPARQRRNRSSKKPNGGQHKLDAFLHKKPQVNEFLNFIHM